jgi:uncharacterized protein YecE (DUF72 family)
VDQDLPELLPVETPANGFDRAALARNLASLAADGIFIGTSSWKYPGWLASVYSERCYVFRGKFATARFDDQCLAEYAEAFPTVGVDASYYTFPNVRSLVAMAKDVPATFRFSFKVTENITLKRFPGLPRFGDFAGQANPNFLNVELFRSQFLTPLESIHDRVGLIMFEFSRFYAPDFARGRDFVAALDTFLGALPRDWRYGVEIRNRNLLQSEFFTMLAAHGVAYLFNLWSGGLTLPPQLAMEGCFSAPFSGGRLLIKPGSNYEECERRYAPFDRVHEPWPEARAAAVRLMQTARERGRTPLFLYIGNKFEGSAPLSIAAMAEEYLAAKRIDS